MHTDYQPVDIEKNAQSDWNRTEAFKATEDTSCEKFYCLSMLPYPSGELHMGHVRNYTIGDVIARYQRMKGKNVLQPMGWDAFGLPAENAAIARQLAPNVWTRQNIEKMRAQLKQLGLAIDWSREIATCDPEYYRWEQWIFIQLFKKGLAYKKKSLVNWDPVDQTVLANEQVIDGKGWRSGAPVERREIAQWFLKITHYAEDLLTGLDELTNGWPQQVIQMQRNWIGKSTGVEIDFIVDGETLTVYTTRADTLFGVTYLAIAIEHPLAQKAAKNNAQLADFLAACKKSSVSEADIATQEKVGMNTGLFAVHPITGEKIPVWVTNFVLMEYGSGAVMSVPAHDERDHEFAKKYQLSLKPVIKAPENWDFEEAAYTEYGELINSSAFNGFTGKEAIEKIQAALIEKKLGKTRTNYRLRDWGISRQRYWGAPIPIVHCDSCGDVPVDEKELPVLLPDHLIPTGKASPLTEYAEFFDTTCPSCGKKAKRETDTMDTFMESSWYYLRYCSPDQHNKILDERANYWEPVDQYIGGIEHAVLHLLYARFMHKVLRDLGVVKSNEPFKKLLTQGMVLKDGAKMSKSKGNVVAPEGLIQKYGADTVRLFMIFASPPEQSLEWSDAGVEGAFRFLKKLWKFATQLEPVNSAISEADFSDQALQNQYRQLQQILQQANQDMERQQFNTIVSASMKILNLLQEIASSSDEHNRFLHIGCHILLRLLAPITPHITTHLWKALGYGDEVMNAAWPIENQHVLAHAQCEIILQINGKLRGKMMIAPNAEQDIVKSQALTHESVVKHIENKTIQRVVVVPNRLVNIVVSG